MVEPFRVSRVAARRFVLGRQGLWPGVRWEGEGGTRSAMRDVENLQLDPLVIVARSHDLMLHSRVQGYRPEFFNQLAYGNREFFDWGGWLAVRPMDELPYWRVLMARNAGHGNIRRTFDEHAPAVDAVRAMIRNGEPIAAEEIGAVREGVLDHYRGGKDTSVALYALWRTGEVMTHHREGFKRYYAATESVAPPELLARTVSDAEAERFFARKSVAFAGIGPLQMSSFVMVHKYSANQLRAIEADLVDAGELMPVQVEGSRAARFVTGADFADLVTVSDGGVPGTWAAISDEPEVRFLSPLDPVSARGRSSELFDFEYTWEIYKKPEDVRYGRYVMPMLLGDELIGRMESKFERERKTLVVRQIWMERPETEDDAEVARAVGRGARRLLGFLGGAGIDPSGVSSARLRAALS